MKNLYRILSFLILSAICFSSCKQSDLNLYPTNDKVGATVYTSLEAYKAGLVKMYASFGLVHSSGATASSDIGGLNVSFADFLRLFWMSQELTTDEAICGWGDTGVPDLVQMKWTADNQFLRGLYSRALYQITICNEFLRESTPEKLAARNISATEDIKHFRAEARFLRAYQYWVLLDAFGNPPFVTEQDAIGKQAPKQIQRSELFKYVEAELIAINDDLMEPRTNEYGRADKGAAWALLSRLYLNAEVYTGTARYTDAITYSQKVINAGYKLAAEYKNLFLTDNNVTSKDEMILTINYDANKTQNNGGTTYIINASVDPGTMQPASFGIPNGGWSGNRVRSTIPAIFGDYSGATDKRAMFFGNKIQNDNMSEFGDGLKAIKFRNVSSQGVPSLDINSGTFCSLDFAIFRLAEQYLIYGEAVLRGGSGGSINQAIAYVNELRKRAYGNTSGNVPNINLDFFLDERVRELYWEGFRRTDLIRYNKFTESTYVWPYKGGVKSGAGVDASRRLFPLPTADIISNTNLIQNKGY
ncbi:RagB/SusD family nutrient uptake outer membrane protein [Sphingobacterium thalpophilum]|uniref:RagB/SusD family nutrient uptake outer membrane protein n=1 Tax=Sphingobacterium thalpophilum TaxID=259 RepID=A0ABV4HB54_9SPHI